MASSSAELQPLARRLAEIHERRRWLRKEIAFIDCRTAEARFEKGQLRGRSRRKRLYGEALSTSLEQLAQQRDGLVRQLDASEIGLEFEISSEARSAWAALVQSFNNLRRGNGIANPSRSRQSVGLSEGPALFPPPERWETIRSELSPLHLRNGQGEDLLFFPGFLLLYGKEEDALALIDIRDIKLAIPDPPAPEQRTAPPSEEPGEDEDKEAAPKPKARKRVVARIAPRADRVAAGPARLLLTSETGLREVFEIRDRDRCSAFVEAMANYQSRLPSDPFVVTDPDPAERLPTLDIPERYELPSPPPPSRLPVTVSGAAAAAVLLWAVGQVVTTDVLDRVWGGTTTFLSQAPDRIVALVEPEAPTTGPQTPTTAATEPQTPATEPQTPATESQTPATESQSATTEPTPATEPPTPTTASQTAAMDENASSATKKSAAAIRVVDEPRRDSTDTAKQESAEQPATREGTEQPAAPSVAVAIAPSPAAIDLAGPTGSFASESMESDTVAPQQPTAAAAAATPGAKPQPSVAEQPQVATAEPAPAEPAPTEAAPEAAAPARAIPTPAVKPVPPVAAEPEPATAEPAPADVAPMPAPSLDAIIAKLVAPAEPVAGESGPAEPAPAPTGEQKAAAEPAPDDAAPAPADAAPASAPSLDSIIGGLVPSTQSQPAANGRTAAQGSTTSASPGALQPAAVWMQPPSSQGFRTTAGATSFAGPVVPQPQPLSATVPRYRPTLPQRWHPDSPAQGGFGGFASTPTDGIDVDVQAGTESGSTSTDTGATSTDTDAASTDTDAASTDADAASTDSDAASTDSDAASTDSDAASTDSDAASTDTSTDSDAASTDSASTDSDADATSSGSLGGALGGLGGALGGSGTGGGIL